MKISQQWLFAFLALILVSNTANAVIIESLDLNIIDDAGNPSDGLRYLDMTYSDGLTQAAALTAAQAAYSNARLATASEWDDLFAAASITYSGALTAADAFNTGSTEIITSRSCLECEVLLSQLGATYANTSKATTYIWSQPDGSATWATTTRDFLRIENIGSGSSFASIEQHSATPEHPDVGWLLVSDNNDIPEPTTLTLMGLALAGLGFQRRKNA